MAIAPAMSETDKFMHQFDPENSNREKRKQMRKKTPAGKAIFGEKKVHDERGFLVTNEADLCDCLVTECPGCHFPCVKCRSPKCGIECRINRKWVYEQMEVEGTSIEFKHPYVQSLESLITSAISTEKQHQLAKTNAD